MPAETPPAKGEVYRHPRLRSYWTVKSCGPKWITLKSNQLLPDQRIPTAGFMAAVAWERVR